MRKQLFGIYLDNKTTKFVWVNRPVNFFTFVEQYVKKIPVDYFGAKIIGSTYIQNIEKLDAHQYYSEILMDGRIIQPGESR